MSNTILVDKTPSTLTLYSRAILVRRDSASQYLPAMMIRQEDIQLNAGHVQEYARICGFAQDGSVPVMYPHMLAFPLQMLYMTDARFPYKVIGMVHLANEIEMLRPLRLSDRIAVEISAGKMMVHEKGQIFTICSEVFSAGELVWRSNSIYLNRSVRNPEGEPYEATLAEQENARVEQTIEVPSDIGRRYAKVSGDMNPIHMSNWSAKLLGFNRAIAHGMWTKARATSALLKGKPDYVNVLAEFKLPVFLPAKIDLWAKEEGGSVLFGLNKTAAASPHMRGRLIVR